MIKQILRASSSKNNQFGNHLCRPLRMSIHEKGQISKRFVTTTTVLGKEISDDNVIKNSDKPKLTPSKMNTIAQFDSENANDDDFDNLSELVDMQFHTAMLQEYHLQALNTQQLVVVQPIKLSKNNSHQVNRDNLMMAESIGLVDTLGWTVLDKIIMQVDNQRQNKYFLDNTQVNALRECIEKLETPRKTSSTKPVQPKEKSYETKKLGGEQAKSSYVSAVFVSTFRLSSRQRLQLEKEIGKPVLDRYNIVLQIFKRHANSKEAKLQSELAEIPYLKSRLLGDYEIELESKYDPSLRKGEKFFSTRRMVLSKRERHLRAEIEKVRISCVWL